MTTRVKRLTINPEIFFKLMAPNSAWKIENGVPADARMRGFLIDPHTQNLVLFVEHESFEPIDLSREVAPPMQVDFRRIVLKNDQP